MQLSKKQKPFCQFIFCVSEMKIKLWTFWKKKVTLIAYVFLKI